MAGYKIPKPFQDEDKYLKFFNKKQLLFIGSAVAISVFIMSKLWHAPFVLAFLGAVVCVTLVLFAVLFSSFSMPKERYLWGGGTTLYKLGMRLLRKRTSAKRVLYVKNYGDHKVYKKTKPTLLSKIIKFEDD